MKEWGPMLQPWIASAIEASGTGHLGEMILGGSAGMSRLLTMEQDEFQAVPFSRLAEIPSVGVMREHQAKVLRAFDAFVDMRKVVLEFNKLTTDALNRSMESVIERLIEKGEKGETVQSVRELNRLWLDCADDVFTKMYASEEYLQVQHELSRAGMTYKIKQQDVVELVLKSLNLPTRGELDDAYKTIYELRREVKSLKRAVDGLQITAEQAKPPARNAIKELKARKPAKAAASQKAKASKNTAPGAKSNDS
jgi:class III poly(R)-hydroxyalkanoic acid synthase PhaE subunit